MKREDVLNFCRRPWSEIRRAKDEYWLKELERMTLSEAFELADSLRLSALQIAGDSFLTDREEDLRDLIELKRMLTRADAAGRR